jgi:hypothetical protein
MMLSRAHKLEHEFLKTTSYHSRLQYVLDKGRRSKLISMNSIRDDGANLGRTPWWGNQTEFLDSIRYQAEFFTLDRQEGQDRRVYIWCEAAGMIPMVEKFAHKYSVPIASSGGFASTYATHKMGALLAEHGHVLLLQIGDYDGSGEHIRTSTYENVSSFALNYGGIVDAETIAVTPRQIDELKLETALTENPNHAHNKNRLDDRVVQAEAIKPEDLEQIVVNAIESNLDMDLYTKMVEREIEERDKLTQATKNLHAA